MIVARSYNKSGVWHVKQAKCHYCLCQHNITRGWTEITIDDLSDFINAGNKVCKFCVLALNRGEE